MKKIDARFDVVLLDLQMPELDGISAAKILREQSYPGPIIALTGGPSELDLSKYYSAGCSHLMLKSEIRHSLLPLIANCLA